MNDFTVISNREARRLAALENFFRRITQTAVTNQYQGQDGLRLVEIRNILEEVPADVLMHMNETMPREKPVDIGEMPGIHEF